MADLEQIISDYLIAEDTDYAIMINGDWGCGKTYYVKDTLFKIIEKIKSSVIDSSKKTKRGHNTEYKLYEPVYISLYGLVNVEHIGSKILTALFPILQSKVALVLKTGIKRLLSEDEQKAIESFVGIAKNKVLFFDDLERISPNLNIQEVLGALNAYTEHQRLKVVVICNDRKVPDEYMEFKEKTVRFSYNYQSSISDVYNNIVSKIKSEPYRQFLLENENTVLQILKTANYTNLRTLRFVLDIFQKLYEQTVESKFEFQTQILERLFFFTTIYSVEYKDGKSKKDLDSLVNAVNYRPSNLSSLLSDGQKKQEKEIKQPEYYKLFAEKYENIRFQFHYYPDVADYIWGGYLNADKFKETIINTNAEIKKGTETEEGQIIKKLKNWALIADDEFNPLIDGILDRVRKSKFDLYAYPTIYAELTQFEFLQIENFKITPEITKSFKTAIDNSKPMHKYNSAFKEKVPMRNDSKEKYHEIYDYAVQANDEIGRAENNKKIDIFIEMISKNQDTTLQNYMSDINNRHIFKEVDANNVFAKLILANGKTIKAFVSGIYAIYPEYNKSSLSNEERAFFVTMNDIINNYLSSLQTRSIKVSFLIYLNGKINEILQ